MELQLHGCRGVGKGESVGLDDPKNGMIFHTEKLMRNKIQHLGVGAPAPLFLLCVLYIKGNIFTIPFHRYVIIPSRRKGKEKQFGYFLNEGTGGFSGKLSQLYYHIYYLYY